MGPNRLKLRGKEPASSGVAAASAEEPTDAKGALEGIFRMLHRESGVDFTRYRQTTIAPEHAANGRVVAVVVFAYDVTEHKRVEHELSQQKLRLSSLVSAIPDMVFRGVRTRTSTPSTVLE